MLFWQSRGVVQINHCLEDKKKKKKKKLCIFLDDLTLLVFTNGDDQGFLQGGCSVIRAPQPVSKMSTLPHGISVPTPKLRTAIFSLAD